jgi:hypothetical protein
VYWTVDLSAEQKQMFLQTVENLDPKTQDDFSLCSFDPHHTVRFYAREELLSTMQICFKCSQVAWRDAPGLPPWSLFSGLHDFFERIGLKPDQNWSELAWAHLQMAQPAGVIPDAPLQVLWP